MAEIMHINQDSVVGIEDERCRITFDRKTGRLLGIANKALGDEYLKGDQAEGMPFRLELDFAEEFELVPKNVSGMWRTDTTRGGVTVLPQDCELVEVQRKDNGLSLRSRAHGLEMLLSIVLEPDTGVSDWSLRVTNLADTIRDIMVSFPCLNGVSLGDGSTSDLATVLEQAGRTAPAWSVPGGIVGRSPDCSMQWHAVWNPKSGAAFELIMMDPDILNKLILFENKALELRYFPPNRIPPGASLDLPPVRFLVYEGTWRPAARAYRKWFGEAFRCVEPPAWFHASDSWEGRHFAKGTTDGPVQYGIQTVLDSFRDMPRAHLRIPFDNTEYAFHCRGSMLYGTHTDGDNVVREDMGGAAAMREGIAAVHRLGLHTTLYIEGYIVHNEGELAKSGKAKEWSVMNRDGSTLTHYTNQNFSHMCPGAKGWQDHLADTVARLLRETGADGVRLDSLGFYFNPCYNPAHRHPTPFGYNEWMKELLAKVRAAAVGVNPDALLTTEAPVDWYGQWFHGALAQTYPRDLPPMRLALATYRPGVYAPGGPVWGSVSGFAGGRSAASPDMEDLEKNWLCARFPVHNALVWGDVADEDPLSSDAEIVTRRFVGDGYEAVVAVRPACQDTFRWPASTGLSETRNAYTLTLSGAASDMHTAFLCDIETLIWRPLEIEREGSDIRMALETNWALIVLTKADGPPLATLDPLPALHPGESVKIQLGLLDTNRKTKVRVTVDAPGLSGPPHEVSVPGVAKITVPEGALPGFYAVKITGDRLLGAKRFLKVE